MQARVRTIQRLLFSALFVLLSCASFPQAAYTFTIDVVAEKCMPGTAALEIGGVTQHDKVQIDWSTGQRDLRSIRDLTAGSYWVSVTISSLRDTITLVTDTTLYFSVEKKLCPVSVPLHFSPNGDGYNDELYLSNIHKHPRFELQIFNKWGQVVHKQKADYTPWNGEWNGIPLPDGSYFYILIYDNADPQTLQKGDLTILR